MVLETIYVVRHGFRMAYSLDPYAIRYYSNIPTPTGLPADPALSSYGEKQAEQLGVHLTQLSPPIDQIISSPYYRCLQTIKPGVLRLQREKGYKNGVRLESGFEEWYGATGDHRTQPRPLNYQRLKDKFFQDLDLRWEPQTSSQDDRGGRGTINPNIHGESIAQLHDRVAYALFRTIEKADKEGWRSIIICSHAAVIISIGRALTGKMPEDPNVEDFYCYTASLSRYERRQPYRTAEKFPSVGQWDDQRQHHVPDTHWRGGRGVLGGWDSILNGDCSFLEGGEERGWHFNGDESFITDPGAFEDPENKEKVQQRTGDQSTEEDLNLNRALCIAVAQAEDDERQEDNERNRSKL